MKNINILDLDVKISIVEYYNNSVKLFNYLTEKYKFKILNYLESISYTQFLACWSVVVSQT